MTRWLPAIATGALLVLVAILVVLALRPSAPPTMRERADSLARDLRCPDCQGLSVADSPTTSAQEIRRQVDELVAGGATDAEVRAHFVGRYGEWILLAPSSPIVWLVPFVLLAAGVAGLFAWLARRRTAPEAERPAVTAADRRRAREEADALDA